MIILLSPSKTLDFDSLVPVLNATEPEFMKDTELLIRELRKKTKPQIAKMMDLSDKLAQLNFDRYQNFEIPASHKNTRPALQAFKGDVYDGIDVDQYNNYDFAFAQKHLRILSGLYGLLRPLDLIQPYRLEMGTKLKNTRGKDLYAFWGERITRSINAACKASRSKFVINLASEEYFKAVHPIHLDKPLINIVFKERKGKQLKIVGLMAKKARGKMANYIIMHRIHHPDMLKSFNRERYEFKGELSDETHYVFVR